MARKKNKRSGKNAAANDDTEDKPEQDAEQSFFDAQADDDRTDARSKILKTGLESAKQHAGDMAKLAAAGLATEDESLRAALLNELATLGESVRDCARKAVRESKAETRNVQP